MKFKDIVPESSYYYRMSYRFFTEWMAEIKKLMKKRTRPTKRGLAFNIVQRRWLKNMNEQAVADVSFSAMKVMEVVKKNNPEISKYL